MRHECAVEKDEAMTESFRTSRHEEEYLIFGDEQRRAENSDESVPSRSPNRALAEHMDVP